MECIDFKQSGADPYVDVWTTFTTIVAVYVDYLIVITKTAEEM